MYTVQNMKFSIKDISSKCDQIRRKLRIWFNFLKKSFMENFTFCAVVLDKKLSEKKIMYLKKFSNLNIFFSSNEK